MAEKSKSTTLTDASSLILIFKSQHMHIRLCINSSVKIFFVATARSLVQTVGTSKLSYRKETAR